MIPRPSYMGAGTRNSPIAIDDSEDEVFLELYHNSNKSSPQNPIPPLPEDNKNMHFAPPLDTFHRPPDSRTNHMDKKRKRGNSFTSQDGPVASSSNSHRRHPTLVNRLSQPESKKAKKRRRRAERQALEEARLQNINWLNNTNPPQPFLPPIPSWPMETISHPMDYSLRNTPDSGDIIPGYYARRIPSPPPEDYLAPHLEGLSYRYPPLPYEELDSLRPPPPPATSDWVSSMALAADYPFSQSGLLRKSPEWSPMATPAPLPPVPPPPMPPPVPVQPSYSSNGHPVPGSIPRPTVEHHALPSKPVPPQPVVPIGMKPDSDPNSKHGVFHITPATKEAGSDMKKRSPSYMPNPARTLVMEQLPKTYRQPDFINKWSRLACGSAPVHIFIDVPNGKALIEFATAEQARKAWASPKLGSAYAGMKSHQLKGKPREDLIKVWWYRVDGVGAGAGVGEIEEGEIEGDSFADKEVEAGPKKETKKERKARLAREREEKRQREFGARLGREQQEQLAPPPHQQRQFEGPLDPQMHLAEVGIPPLSAQGSTIPPTYPFYPNQTPSLHPQPPRYDTPTIPWPYFLPEWNNAPSSRSSTSTNVYNKSAYGASWQDNQDDGESIASSTGRSGSPSEGPRSYGVASTSGQGTEQYDDEEVVDMEVDTEELSPVLVSQPQLPATNPVHHSLPARPNVGITAQASRLPLPKPPPPSATAQVFVPRSAQNIPQATQKPEPPFIEQKPQQPIPIVQERLSNLPRFTSTSQMIPSTNYSVLPIATPQPKLPSNPAKLLSSESIGPPPSSAATAPPTSASATSSLSSVSLSSTPIPSEPKAMKNAPTEPSFTKRALMARQKELEEKIAKSKMELAAAANKVGTPTAAVPPTEKVVKPGMDLGEKQAMEDRLRKLVLQSRKPAAAVQQQQTQQQPPPPPNNVTASLQTPAPHSSTVELATSAPPAEKPTPPKPSTVSVSTGSFSLEDMAVSFITQTIETMKSQPASVPEPSLPAQVPASTPASSSAPKAGSQADVRLELAAKQKLLEDHISESKSLMTQLSLARTKHEKDNIMRTMREKTRLFEEASSGKMNTTSSTSYQMRTMRTTTTTTTQQLRITRWPASCEDAGMLILSDDDDEFEDDED